MDASRVGVSVAHAPVCVCVMMLRWFGLSLSVSVSLLFACAVFSAFLPPSPGSSPHSPFCTFARCHARGQ